MPKFVRIKDVRSLIRNEKTQVTFLRCVKRPMSYHSNLQIDIIHFMIRYPSLCEFPNV